MTAGSALFRSAGKERRSGPGARWPGKRAAAVFVMFCSLAAGPVLAQVQPYGQPGRAPAPQKVAGVQDIYTIRDIMADETAETAIAARDLALVNARRAGFLRLMRRLLLQEDRARAPIPADDQLADLVSNFEVADEKSSGQRYLARLTMRFDADKVRALLRQANIGFSESAGRATLVLPVLDTPDGQLLWEENNEWHAALSSAIEETGAARDRLLPVLLPLGDFLDVPAITAQQAVRLEQARLDILSRRYGAEEAVVLHAVQSPLSGPGGGIAFEISQRRPGDHWEMPPPERIQGASDEPFAAVLRRAALLIVNRMQDDWTRQTLLDFSAQGSLEVTAMLSSLTEWREIQKRLAGLPMIRQMELRALSVTGAQMQWLYLGTPEKLSAALGQQGLTLTEEAGQWRLSRISQ